MKGLKCSHNFYCEYQQWYAITLSNVGDFEGVKIKIQNSYVLKEHFEVSAKAGEFCFKYYYHLNYFK